MATSYNSYSYLAAAAAAQQAAQQPVVGSLETLRANAMWNMPHGPAFLNGQPNAGYLGTSHARCANMSCCLRINCLQAQGQAVICLQAFFVTKPGFHASLDHTTSDLDCNISKPHSESSRCMMSSCMC